MSDQPNAAKRPIRPDRTVREIDLGLNVARVAAYRRGEAGR